ncbi:MAG: helix-turn-helix domain-containing protein, partial [Aestuariibacter sp.]|nr:helix-turn-helix domain-containing protein [Aestuariibacter sp.]
VEVKLLAAQARDSGLASSEIAKMVGASSNSVDKWWRLYRDGGSEALVTFRQNPKTRKLCAQMQKKIEQHRLEMAFPRFS